VLLADQGHAVPQIARLILRGDDLVRRVLQRFQDAGVNAVPRRYAPGRQRLVTPAWEAELLRVIELDPHAVDVPSANWITRLPATYLARVTGSAVDPETVRLYLHSHDYVCKRPTWTLKRKAREQAGYRGNACG
jgi:transposase